MDALKSWGLAVCLAALAAGIAGIIAPSGKMEKVFKFAVSLFFLCCMIVPLFTLKNIPLGSVNLTQAASVPGTALNATVEKQKEDMAGKSVADLVRSCCADCGAQPINVQVTMKKNFSGEFDVGSAEIKLKPEDNAKRVKIADTIKSKLGIDVKFEEGEK